MKEYIKGNKRVRIQRIDDFNIKFDFWEYDKHTSIVADIGQYIPFLNYLKKFWLNV